MNIDVFLAYLKELDVEIDRQMEFQEKNKKKKFEQMQNFIQKLEELLPDWFFFIEQTEIGTKEHILTMLSDIEEAMRAEDSILLADTLLYGLQATVEEYIEIINEAISDE